MAVVYESVTWSKIEHPLMDILIIDFPNVYISPRYKKSGNEAIRINIDSSEDIATTHNFEQRLYNLTLRYYFEDVDITNMMENESIKNKVDRLKKKFLDMIVTLPTSKHSGQWDEALVNTITYDIQDDENEDNPDLYIVELDCSIQHTYNH